MLNKDALNWKAKTGFFWGSICVLCIVWCYYRLPEPRGKTYGKFTFCNSHSTYSRPVANLFCFFSGELDVLFANRVPARAFKDAKADQYTDNGHVSEKMEVSEKIEA